MNAWYFITMIVLFLTSCAGTVRPQEPVLKQHEDAPAVIEEMPQIPPKKERTVPVGLLYYASIGDLLKPEAVRERTKQVQAIAYALAKTADMASIKIAAPPGYHMLPTSIEIEGPQEKKVPDKEAQRE